MNSSNSPVVFSHLLGFRGIKHLHHFRNYINGMEREAAPMLAYYCQPTGELFLRGLEKSGDLPLKVGIRVGLVLQTVSAILADECQALLRLWGLHKGLRPSLPLDREVRRGGEHAGIYKFRLQHSRVLDI